MSHGLKFLRSHFGLLPTGIIHVGANRGQELPAFRQSGIRPVVLVEPLDAPFRTLVAAIDGESGIYPVQACLSEAPGRVVRFHVASNEGMSSSYLQPTRHLDVVPSVKFAESIELTTSTLDDVVQTLAATHGVEAAKFDYLGLDTQGSELDILRGASRALARLNYVYTEVSFGTLYEGSCSVYDLIEFLRPAGFDLYELEISAGGWGDALFARAGWVDAHLAEGRAAAARQKERRARRRKKRRR